MEDDQTCHLGHGSNQEIGRGCRAVVAMFGEGALNFEGTFLSTGGHGLHDEPGERWVTEQLIPVGC